MQMRMSHPYISSPGKKIEEQLQNPQNYLAVRPIKIDYDHGITFQDNVIYNKVIQNYKKERFKNIKHEFKIMDKNNNGYLSQEEILDYLKNEKVVKQINMKVIQELFDSMDTNTDGRVSLCSQTSINIQFYQNISAIQGEQEKSLKKKFSNFIQEYFILFQREEFAHNYICRESELKREIQLYEEQIIKLDDEKASIIQQLNNRHRINIRYLKICLEQANLSSFKIYQKLYETEQFSVKAIVCCDKVRVDQMNEISTKLSQNIAFPAWHEIISFEIDNLLQDNDVVQIQIKFVKQTHDNERRITNEMNQIQFAESNIKISNLGQEYHEDSWIDVLDAKDKNLKIGVVHVKVDYIPNEIEYRKNRLEEIEGEIKDLSDQKQFKGMEQNYLNKLFGTIQHSPQQIRKRNQIEDETKSEQDFFSTFAFTNNQQSAINEFDFHEAFKLRDYGVYVLVIFNIILCLFERCDFFGFIILARVLPFIRKNWSDKEIYFFLYTLSFSALFDLFYLIFLNDMLTDEDQYGRYTINLISWILSLIYFLIKVRLYFISFGGKLSGCFNFKIQCGISIYFVKIQNINFKEIFQRSQDSSVDQSMTYQHNNNNIINMNASQYRSQLLIDNSNKIQL